MGTLKMESAPVKGAKTEPVSVENQTRIELSKIKFFAAGSEETHCYTAVVLFDKKPVGTVSNNGHGGCDDFRVTNSDRYDAMQAYIATFDSITTTLGGNEAFSYMPDLETVCGELMNRYLVADQLKKLMRKRVVLCKPETGGTIQQSNTARNAAQRNAWAAAYQAEGWTVLNLLPFADALVLFEAGTS